MVNPNPTISRITANQITELREMFEYLLDCFNATGDTVGFVSRPGFCLAIARSPEVSKSLVYAVDRWMGEPDHIERIDLTPLPASAPVIPIPPSK